MGRFVESADRNQSALFPECLEDWVDENKTFRVIEALVSALDLAELGFDGVVPAVTGRPSYHPAILLMLYIYGYLNRVQSSRRLAREDSCNVELMWLTGSLAPDHKTIANFRKDNGAAIRKVCTRFVGLCRKLGLKSVQVLPLMVASSKQWTIVTDPSPATAHRVWCGRQYFSFCPRNQKTHKISVLNWKRERRWQTGDYWRSRL